MRRVVLMPALLLAAFLVSSCGSSKQTMQEAQASAAVIKAEASLPRIDGVSETLRYAYDQCSEADSVPPQVILTYVAKEQTSPLNAFRNQMATTGWVTDSVEERGLIMSQSFDGVPIQIVFRQSDDKAPEAGVDSTNSDRPVTLTANVTVAPTFDVCN